MAAAERVRLYHSKPAVGASITEEQVRQWITSGESRGLIDVLVTPEIAKVMLEYNKPGETNRNLSPSSVGVWVRALQTKAWENTGEPIIFSNATLMNDGQHRLEAVVKSGVPAIMDLRFGVARHALAATNSGSKRSGSDALQMTGHINTTISASVSRLVIAYEQGLPGSARARIPNADIVRGIDRWPDIPEAIKYAGQLKPHMRNAALNTLAFFASRTGNEASVREFFHILQTGEGSADNPPHQLREMFTVHRGGQDTGTRVVFLARAIKAWNRWQHPATAPKNIEWKLTQPYPEVIDLKL